MTTSGNVSCPINNNNNDLRKTTTKLRFLYDYVPKADWANYPTNWMNDWGSEWVREWMNECECKRMGFALLINLIVVVLVNPTIMPYQTACLLRQVSLSCLIRILILIPMHCNLWLTDLTGNKSVRALKRKTLKILKNIQ